MAPLLDYAQIGTVVSFFLVSITERETYHIEAIGGKVVDDPQKAVFSIGRQVLVARHSRVGWGVVGWEDSTIDRSCIYASCLIAP